MHASRPLLAMLVGMLGTAGVAQVYDWSMQTGGTGPYQVANLPYWGPRNYIAAGNFNSSNFTGFLGFNNCDETNFATWSPGWTQFSGNEVTPSPLFNRNTPWPYSFRWNCSFDETFSMTHPANFYAGVISLKFYEITFGGVPRYNYMLFELKQPLTPGVEYAFQGRLAAGKTGSTPAFPFLDQVGLAFVHDLPTPDSAYAFLDSITPFITTPADVILGPTPTLFNDTIIGNGERYLVVGLFNPFDSLSTSDTATLGSQFEYVLENFFLYRPDCGYSNTQFWEPNDEACRDEPYEVELQYGFDTSPNRQWYVDGALQVDSTDYRIIVPYSGSPGSIVTAVTDIGACTNSASFTVQWRGLDAVMPDTFTVCGAPVELVVDTALHFVNPWQVQVDWEELTGTFYLNNQPSLDITLPDSGIYAAHIAFSGCLQHDTLTIGPDRPLQGTNMSGDPALLPEIFPEHCVNMYDGAVEIHDMGYPGTLQFDWYDTPLAGSDTNRVDSLASGTWHVRITDDQYRCSEFAHTIPQLLDLCAMIRGTVYDDRSWDCVQDSAEVGRGYSTVRAMPVGNVAVTAADGSYELLVPPGSHTVEEVYTDPWVGNVCGDGVLVSVPTAGFIAESIDIADTTHVPVHDLAILYVTGSAWVIGTTAQLTLVVRNTGELPDQASLRVYLAHPDLTLATDISGATFMGFAGDTLLAQTGPLQPGQQVVVYFSCPIPPEPELISTVAQLHFAIVPVPEETDLADNELWEDFPIVGAYDPNDKLVFPYGDPQWHSVDTTVHHLRYTIRFQNTGNYPATTVRLEDQLPAGLVPQSLQVHASSHAMQAYSFGSTLHFEFPSIMLPDSTSDPEGSMGWVRFTLAVAPGVQYGDSILNTANIYFDQNPPIITPPAITRFLSPIALRVPGTAAVITAAQRFRLVPNPAMGYAAVVDVEGGSPILGIELVQTSGGVRSVVTTGADRLDLGTLAPGTYAVRIFTREGAHVVKLVKY